MENKGRGRQLSAIEPAFSLFLIRAELQSAWRHRNRPSRQLGSRRDWRGRGVGGGGDGGEGYGSRGRLVVMLANSK